VAKENLFLGDEEARETHKRTHLLSPSFPSLFFVGRKNGGNENDN